MSLERDDGQRIVYSGWPFYLAGVWHSMTEHSKISGNLLITFPSERHFQTSTNHSCGWFCFWLLFFFVEGRFADSCRFNMIWPCKSSSCVFVAVKFTRSNFKMSGLGQGHPRAHHVTHDVVRGVSQKPLPGVDLPLQWLFCTSVLPGSEESQKISEDARCGWALQSTLRWQRVCGWIQNN